MAFRHNLLLNAKQNPDEPTRVFITRYKELQLELDTVNNLMPMPLVVPLKMRIDQFLGSLAHHQRPHVLQAKHTIAQRWIKRRQT